MEKAKKEISYQATSCRMIVGCRQRASIMSV